MKDTSQVTAMVIDNGLFIDLALRLAKDFRKVYYHVPWISAFPKMNNGMIGHGFEELEVVESIYDEDVFDDIDVFIFPDVYFGHEQKYLVSLGKTVWGGRLGEELELSREGMKELLSELDLPVGPYQVVKGTAALRRYLKANEDQFVKINKWRGTFETFHAPNYRMVEPKLDEVEYNLGAFKSIVEFIVEGALNDKVEYGTDCWTIDGKYPTKLFSGIEVKDKGFIGCFTDYVKIPEPLTRFNEAIRPVLKKYGYRGFFSSEVRIGEDHEPYMIDFCARAPSPPNEVYQEIYSNLADVIWKGANGIVVDPVAEKKFGAEILIHSSWADKNWQPIDFPDKLRNRVKLRNATKIDGRYYVIPQSVGLPEIGAVIGLGNTLEEAVKEAKSVAKQVSGYYIEIPDNALDEAEEEIKKLAELDLAIF
jgi:predicted RNase H-like HicB family nuclease